MLEFFKKLMFASQIKGEGGTLTILDIPVFIVSAGTIAGLQDIITEEMGDKGALEIYLAGKNAGIQFASEHMKRLGLKGPKLYELIENLVEMGGWGDITPEKIDYENGRAKFNFKNSPFPNLLKSKSRLPVCHLIRGLIAGSCSVLFQKQVDCIETACKKSGQTMCGFDVIPTDQLDWKSPSVKQQVPRETK